MAYQAAQQNWAFSSRISGAYEGRSQMSRTQSLKGYKTSNVISNRSQFGTEGIEFAEVAEQLRNVNEKMERGFANSVMMRQLKQQRTRENSYKGPDIDGLRKEQEEKQ